MRSANWLCVVPLASLKDLVFGAWDIFPDSAYEAALNAGVLEKELLARLKEPLKKIKPMKAVFDQQYVKRLSGTNVKTGKNKLELAEQLIEEIADWKKKNKCSRVVMIWAASTEVFLKPHPVHKTIESFEKAMRDCFVAYGQNGEAIRPEQGYPLRLMVPGYEGNMHIKWLRRLEIADMPFMTREETSKYTDIRPDGKAVQFSFEMEAKSVITSPSGEMVLKSPGFHDPSKAAGSGP